MANQASKVVASYAAWGLVLTVASSPAWAQSPADLDAARRQAEALQRQQQEQIKRDQDALQPGEKAPGGVDTRKLVPKVDASKAGGKCRDIGEIVIHGAPRLPSSVREQIDKQFAGHCLGVTEIEQILGEITKDYVLRGYVTTRAYLPAQDLSKGKLEITVVEGTIEKLRIEDKGSRSFAPGNTIPAKPGDVLNLRDLEQGIDQINRLASNKATLDIQPGSQAGGSEVVIRNEPESFYHWLFSFDNQGSVHTGKNQGGVSLSTDSLLGWSEFMLFTHREAIPGEKLNTWSTSDSFMLSVPYGYNTFSYNGCISRYVSTILAPSGLELIASGDSTCNAVTWDRVVYRDASTRANVSSTYTNKESRSYLEGQLLGVSSRKLTVLDLDGNVTTGLGPGILGLSVGWAEGLSSAGALRDMDDLPFEAPRAQFKKLKYGASYSLPFQWLGNEWSLNSTLTGQSARTTLYGSEQMAIGGIYTVRGFVNSTLAGDSGYYLRNDLSMRQTISLAGVALPTRWFVALDMGAVRNRVPEVPQGSLVGAALGASISWKGATWDIFGSCPVAMPQFLNRESCQTWFRLSLAI
ncbi:MAG: ShlB/FhaC/HecB family hemolysin secretion/activation protein [Aquabacterium sp.]|uniref:ShlB/FhaC/HecB family hemolysin secretion/activation protein n=1 Tax=Aquabacterium sp. TaxID=1872578 RepID=UPI0025BBDB99|nr:ShlB/FhaC/HecB family hemolysin secretion/activation protein [Aquabacterium sp.]MBI5926569.1 ShlB/FhaC/HecB family hemolysin secretion/activation protein [Aquabacterium sp.]